MTGSILAYKIDILFTIVSYITQHNMKTEVYFLKNLARDITFMVGTNAQDNFAVIDSADPDDVWFHVKDLPSCHVVAKIPDDICNKKELLSIIKRGAIICKQNSKYTSTQNLEIVYTRIRNVKKTNVPGSVTLDASSYVKV